MNTDAVPHPAHKVLYVDDNSVNVLLMSAIFDRIPDVELVTAECARSALEQARGLYPSLLLLDLRLPDLHGAELLRLLRRVPGCEQVPAIAVTAEQGYNGATSGFDGLWLKPFDVNGAIERIQQLLAQPAAPRSAPPAPDFPQLTTPALAARIAAHF